MNTTYTCIKCHNTESESCLHLGPHGFYHLCLRCHREIHYPDFKPPIINYRFVITICGSTKFQTEIESWAWNQTKNGQLILFAPFAKENISDVEDYRRELEQQHKQKIDMSDEVFCFNKNGHIGNSTLEEMKYTINQEKSIEFLEDIPDLEKLKLLSQLFIDNGEF